MSDVRLDGRTVLITGANTGIGKETALDLARRGARIIVGCRNQGRGVAAVDEIKSESGNDNVIVGLVDLASFESIKSFAKHIKETESRLDILINNAGIMACSQSKTKENFEMQFGVNHLGHFLLTKELLELIKSSAPSRIINVSSVYHKGAKINFDDLNYEANYKPFTSYGQSKLANILFTTQLHHRLQGTGVTAFVVHPGIVDTQLTSASHVEGNCCVQCSLKYCRCFFKSPAKGSATSIYCAVTEGLEKDSGKYFVDCAPKTPSAEARDDAVALRLWDVSEQLVSGD